MREDYGTLPMNMHDDGFGEIGFDTPDLVRDGLNPAIDVSKSLSVGILRDIISCKFLG